MMTASIAQAAAIGSVPVAAAAGVITMGSVFAAVFASGLAGVFFQAACPPFLLGIVPREQLVTANARMQGSQSAAQVSGPPISGVLVQVIGAASAVVVDAVSFLVCMLALAAVRAEEPAAVRSRSSVRAEVAEGLRYTAGSPVLRYLATVATLANFLLTALGALEIVFLVRVVGVPAGDVGVLLAITGVGGLAGALLTGRLQRLFGTSLIARATLACTAPFAMLLPLTHRGTGLVLFALGALVPCFGLVVIGITFASIRQLACPHQMLGRVTSVNRLLMSVSMPVGALVGGILGEHFGIRDALIAITAALSAVALGSAAGSLWGVPGRSLSVPVES
jgi:predicted MFS family arabinose efflux permease